MHANVTPRPARWDLRSWSPSCASAAAASSNCMITYLYRSATRLHQTVSQRVVTSQPTGPIGPVRRRDRGCGYRLHTIF